MPGMSNQLSNVLGVAIPYDLKRQLTIRSQKIGADTRSSDDIQYLANKSCWVRLVSSVRIKDLEYFRKYFPNLDVKDPDSLAKKFILFAGTSEYIKNQQSKSGFEYNLRSGFGADGSYGMLGNVETQLYGYRPMPGITDVRIETQGKLGSIRAATINFKVWDKAQLDIVDALYFKLGYTMFLEWGHTTYFDNADTLDFAGPKLQRSDLKQIDPFAEDLKKEIILREISTRIDDSNGNYDAMLGMCTNFNFSMNEDGGFDCTIKMMALGELASQVKINQANALPGILSAEIKELVNIYNEILREKARQEAAAAAAAAATANAQAAAAATTAVVPLSIQETFAVQQIIALLESGTRGFLGLSAGSNPEAISAALNAIVSVEIYREVNKGMSAITGYSTIEGLLNGELEDDNVRGLYGNPPSKSNDVGLAINSLAQRVKQLRISWEFNLIQSTGYKEVKKGTFKIIDDNTSTPNPRPSPIATSNNPALLDAAYKAGTYNTAVDTKIANDIYEAGTNSVGTKEAKFVVAIKQISSAAQYIRVNNIAKTIGKKYDIPTQVNKEFEDDNYNEVKEMVDYLNKIFGKDIAKAGFPRTTDRNTGNLQAPTFQMYSFKIDEKEVNALVNAADAAANPDPNSPRQKNINSIFCGLVDNKVNGGQYTGKTWEEYKVAQAVTAAEESIAKNSCSRAPGGGEATAVPQISADTVQKEEQLQYQSGLEVFIRAIQLHSFNIAYKNLGVKEGKIGTIDLYSKKSEFLKQLFTNGILSEAAVEFVSDKIKDYKDLDKQDNAIKLMRGYASYGFNHNIMAQSKKTQKDCTDNNKIPQVNFKELYKSYVVPYTVNQGIAKDIDINYPVYIKFGLLLLALNHMCTIYDSQEKKTVKATEQTPLIYIDFNPETNFCLSEPLQMSTDPLKMLIPFRGTNEEYAKLFDPKLIDNGKIKAPSGSTETKELFKPQTQDFISSQLPEFRGTDLAKDGYSGKIMNILLSSDYLLSLCKNFANNDQTQSVKLRPFLQQIIDDINKYLGGINLLRLAYDDKSNCLYIVDDQVQPMKLDEKSVPEIKTSSTIPVYGKYSIAKSLEIKTEISSKLSNMIAISANSDIKSDSSKDGTPFGHYNDNYTDRFIPQVLSINSSDTSKKNQDKKPIVNDAEIAAASAFNEFVKCALNTGLILDTNTSAATNYYIDRMNKRKGENPGTESSAMIPVSVNFSTDGLSGLAMGHAFLLPENVLPVSYQKKESILPGNIVGFVVTGLNHSIQNNAWITEVKANMMFLKESAAFKAEKTEYNVAELSTGNFIIPPPPPVLTYNAGLGGGSGSVGGSGIASFSIKSSPPGSGNWNTLNNVIAEIKKAADNGSWKEARSNPNIMQTYRDVENPVGSDLVPWCSAFVGYVLKLAGLSYIGGKENGLWAPNYAKYGQDVGFNRANWKQWDIVVYNSHVGFIYGASEDGKRITTFGGNQSDNVTVSTFPVATYGLKGVRRYWTPPTDPLPLNVGKGQSDIKTR